MSQNDHFLTDYDRHLLKKGTHYRAWKKLGVHLGERLGEKGAWFVVWAPYAGRVSVVGDFNDWNPNAHPLVHHLKSGFWETFVPGVEQGALYRYYIASKYNGYQVQKADPWGVAAVNRPKTSSMVWSLENYTWGDAQWMAGRGGRNGLESPMAIYGVHLGSWMRVPEDNRRWLTYRELAHKLTAYVLEMGFTHVELLPVSEHLFDDSWGYDPVGYFAPTSRYGTPDDFMYFVDFLHQHDIGVIIDWVSAHFPKDEYGIGCFNGTHLYEYADTRLNGSREHDTFIFNYGRPEVANFLLANGLFWIEAYHVDGLRVDNVTSMLYPDYPCQNKEWIPNRYGGRENLEAITFLKRFNELIYNEYPDVITIAEESSAWPMVSRPSYLGGLGFGLKWNTGWVHDTVRYMTKEPVHRKYHHNDLIFGILYAFQENLVLPFSHNEIVSGKGSMIARMPGDEWQRFANLRLLYGYMYTHPGKKLLFMGNEFGQLSEWRHDRSLDWHLLGVPFHAGLQRLVRDLNTLLRGEPALYELDFTSEGFSWIDCHDSEQSVLSFIRRGRNSERVLACACNFTPVPRHNYRIGLPTGGGWEEILNSDATLYGGSGQGNLGEVESTPVAAQGYYHSMVVTLPPLALVVFRNKKDE